jgi:predicted Zn-dependent peptidase
LVIEPLYDGAYEATLENGLRILANEVPQSRSVSVGVWVRSGSRDDPPTCSGLAHFIEHLAFKGTAKRDAASISQEIDAVGGHINAATGKEATFYFAEVPADGLPTAVDVLADLVHGPQFSVDHIELERNVVLEEIRGHEDEPEQVAYDLFAAGLWRDGHPLSRSVLGSRDAIAGVGRDAIVAHHAGAHQPNNAVLVACGAVDAEQLFEIAARQFPERSAPDAHPPERTPPRFTVGRTHHAQPNAQSHIFLGMSAPPAHSEDRFALEVANSILGDGTSSRLFRVVREERGLAYVVTSSVNYYSDAGFWLVYAGVSPTSVDAVLELIHDELARLRRETPPESEIELAKRKLRGHLILGLETTGNRAARLGTAAIQERQILSPDELLDRLDAVGPTEIRRVLDAYLTPDEINLTTVGPKA